MNNITTISTLYFFSTFEYSDTFSEAKSDFNAMMVPTGLCPSDMLLPPRLEH